MQITWSLAGWLLIALSCMSNWKGDKEWGYKYYIAALLNWIIYYLVRNGA